MGIFKNEVALEYHGIMETTTFGIPEERPWGSFTVLPSASYYKLKQLRVKPGNRLSLQMHYKREEHWVVVKGYPEITVGDKVWQAKPGEYIHIPFQTKHRLGNPSPEDVEIIEVQMGEYFGEDDIVRFEDDYQRV
jgi:mannose-6-phosphate isomerase-like protein (cupin superfamily)